MLAAVVILLVFAAMATAKTTSNAKNAPKAKAVTVKTGARSQSMASLMARKGAKCTYSTKCRVVNGKPICPRGVKCKIVNGKVICPKGYKCTMVTKSLKTTPKGKVVPRVMTKGPTNKIIPKTATKAAPTGKGHK